jgi:methyl-accepting chemotaxis protein
MPRIEATTLSQTRIHASLEAASSTLETGMRGYQGVVDAAAETLASGTRGYEAAGASVERMVGALEARHTEILGAASAGLESVFTGPLQDAGEHLAAISAQQAAALVAWQETVGALQGTLVSLNQGTSDAGLLADRFKAAAEPAALAATSFNEAAKRIGGLFPRLDESADGYDRINLALASAAGELTASSTQYQKAGEQIGLLTRELQKTLKYQVLGTQKFAESMDRAAVFVQAIGPASERVERAADGLRSASERTAEVVNTIQTSVSVQDEAMGHMRTTAEMVLQAMQRQSSHWGSFLGELDRLQATLTSSVEAITTKLPHSIDHTLVHFDAALGEGVSRLGGTVERLREAMDDLQERLELVMADSGRRR